MLASESIAKLSLIANDVVFKFILTDKNYKNHLYAKYCEEQNNIDWTTHITKLLTHK